MCLLFEQSAICRCFQGESKHNCRNDGMFSCDSFPIRLWAFYSFQFSFLLSFSVAKHGPGKEQEITKGLRLALCCFCLKPQSLQSLWIATVASFQSKFLFVFSQQQWCSWWSKPGQHSTDDPLQRTKAETHSRRAQVHVRASEHFVQHTGMTTVCFSSSSISNVDETCFALLLLQCRMCHRYVTPDRMP